LKNGVQEFPKSLETLDSGFRRNDGKEAFSTFYEFIRVGNRETVVRQVWQGMFEK
jgi:hypothetical protein